MDEWTVERSLGIAYGVDYRQYLKFYEEQLRKMEPIRRAIVGEYMCDLKIETERVQVWMSLADLNGRMAYICVKDPDGTWVDVDEYRPKNLPVSPWGKKAERERLWRFTSLTHFNREAWAIEQDWPYPLPYMYGGGGIIRCDNGCWRTHEVTTINSLKQEFGIDVGFIGMNMDSSRECDCGGTLEDWCYDPLGMDVRANTKEHYQAYGIDYSHHRHYTHAFLSARPTLYSGHWSNLKIETKRVKVWLVRGDDTQVDIEVADERGDWHKTHSYKPHRRRERA